MSRHLLHYSTPEYGTAVRNAEAMGITDAPKPIPYILDERQMKEIALCGMTMTPHTVIHEQTLREAVSELDWLRNHQRGSLGWREDAPIWLTETVDVCRYYVQHLNHGTAGHNLYVLVATLSEILDRQVVMQEEKE